MHRQVVKSHSFPDLGDQVRGHGQRKKVSEKLLRNPLRKKITSSKWTSWEFCPSAERSNEMMHLVWHLHTVGLLLLSTPLLGAIKTQTSCA